MTTALLVGGGSWLLAYRLLTARVAFFRRLAYLAYRQSGYLLPFRLLPVVAPFLGLGGIVTGMGLLLPHPLNGWAVAPGIALISVGLIGSYRPPHAWMPTWLREDIAAGRLPIVRPDRMDWLVLVVAGPVFVLGPFVMMVWLITVGPGG